MPKSLVAKVSRVVKFQDKSNNKFPRYKFIKKEKIVMYIKPSTTQLR